MKFVGTLVILCAIWQWSLADVSHLLHSNEDRQYLPPYPEKDNSPPPHVYQKVKHTSEKVTVHSHEHNRHHLHHDQDYDHQRVQHEQHYQKNKHDYDERVLEKQNKQNERLKISQPKALPDPPLVPQAHKSLNTFVGDLPLKRQNDNLFTPYQNDDVAYHNQRSNHVFYAHAPHSVFHTQINVQSQDSDYNEADNTSEGNGNLPSSTISAGNLAPSSIPSGGLASTGGIVASGGTVANRPRPTRPHKHHHHHHKHNHRHQQKSQQYDHDGGTHSYDEIILSDDRAQVLPSTVPIERKANYQGVNLINGNVQREHVSSLAAVPHNVQGNAQGVNILNGKLFGSSGSASRQSKHNEEKQYGRQHSQDFSNLRKETNKLSQRKPETHYKSKLSPAHNQHEEQKQYDTNSRNNDRRGSSAPEINIIAFNNNHREHDRIEYQPQRQQESYHDNNNNDEFEFELSANAPEVIYRAGDDPGFDDNDLNEEHIHSAAASSPSSAYEDSENFDTDLRDDGYHYGKPSVGFNF